MGKKNKKDNSLFSYYGFTEKDANKYPVISKILRQLTPEEIERNNEELNKIRIPLTFLGWVKKFNEFGEKNRNDYFWRWLYRTVQTITFPGINRKWEKKLWNTKLLLLMFVTLLDDIADKKNIQNKKLLNALLKAISLGDFNVIDFNKFSMEEKKYIEFTAKVWQRITENIRKYPKYKEYKDIFEYDICQLLNAMNYSYLINKNFYLINKIEYWIYLSHNMQAFLSLDMDLMCSKNFDYKKIGIFRTIGFYAQKMARIGNWVSTWEREIPEEDFTSGVFAYAIDKNIIFVKDLNSKRKLEIIKKIKKAKIEKDLLGKWEECYWEIYKTGKKMNKKYTQNFIFNLEKLISYHLSSRRYK